MAKRPPTPPTPSRFLNSHGVYLYVTPTDVGLSAPVPLNKFDATTDPGVGDDADDGYDYGSRWFNKSAPSMWICMDPTVGAAVWTQLVTQR